MSCLDEDPDGVQPDLFGDDEADLLPVERRIVSAATAPKLRTRAPASVWDLAGCLRTPAFGMVLAEMPPAPPLRSTVTRADGVVRVVGAAYPSNRWDAEREEQERVRRAKQRPPRPPKGARTRGRKVRVWDGEEVE